MTIGFGAPIGKTAVANASNIAWRTRNLLVNPQAAGGVWNFSATLPLSAVFSFCLVLSVLQAMHLFFDELINGRSLE